MYLLLLISLASNTHHYYSKSTSVQVKDLKINEKVQQSVFMYSENEKRSKLVEILESVLESTIIIFINQRTVADELASLTTVLDELEVRSRWA